MTLVAQPYLSCGIMVSSETEQAKKMTIYRSEDTTYLPIDQLILPLNARTHQSNVNAGTIEISVQYDADYIDSNIHFYAASLSGFQYSGKMPLHPTDSFTPRAKNAWSYDGRFIALHNIYGIRNDRLIIYDVLARVYHTPTDL
ncbi:MAG: hypothetical protein H7Y11_07830, partial [Armatimonadetes bacterium]|nr:hypothetical protein [Anaerolineae bacterium]